MKTQILRLFCDYRKFWWWPALFLCIALLAGLIQIGLANVVGRIVDMSLAEQYTTISKLTWTMTALLALEMFRSYINCIINASATERIFLDVRLRLADRLMHADMSTFENNFRTGDIISRVNSDVINLCETLAGQFPWLLRVALTAIIALVYCVWLSWPLALVYLVVMPVSMVIIHRISKPIQTHTKKNADHVGKAMNIALDAFHGIRVVKSFQVENLMNARFQVASDKAVAAAIQSEKTSIILNVVKYVMNILPMFTLFLVSAFLVTEGRLTVGGIIAFITASAHIRTALGLLDYIASSYRRACAMAQRVYEALDILQEAGGEILTPVPGQPAATFDRVAFGYNEEQPLFEAISFQVPIGRKLGLAGLSGSGKSSILKLISRFYAPQGGSLLLLGHEFQSWSPDALRQHIAMVTQEPYLLTGSIYENVACGKEGATREKVQRALEDAALWEFVTSIPEGMDTQVGELGSRLSGGQKQRLTIARAFLKDAPIVLLDEVTSALDEHAEKEIIGTISRLCEGKTVVMVSHRLSMFDLTDEVLFLEHGAIVESGTKDELLDKKGRFAQMMCEQWKVGPMR